MTDDQRIEMLMYQYTPVVNYIIVSNKSYYGISDPIKWRFFFNESPALTAKYDKSEKGIEINVASVDFAFFQKEPYQVEFFILHEIRHMYQHSEMEKIKANPASCDNSNLAKKWLMESANYTPPSAGVNIPNDSYYSQDMEADAFAFAYAVMSYKYGKGLLHLVPHAYDNKAFYDRADTLIEQFKHTIWKKEQ